METNRGWPARLSHRLWITVLTMIQTDRPCNVNSNLSVQLRSWMPTWNLRYLAESPTQTIYTKHSRLHSGIDHSNHLFTMLHDLLLSLVCVTSYLTAWFILCTWQATLLHSSLNVTEEDVITACVPDTVEEIQVWGSLTLMNWSIHCTSNCSPTHQHCFHGNKNLSALSVHGNKMPVHPKPETNLRLKNSMFQASPTSSFWWLKIYLSLILPSVLFSMLCAPGLR